MHDDQAEEGEERPRPRVVDKRVSARTGADDAARQAAPRPAAAEESPPEPAPSAEPAQTPPAAEPGPPGAGVWTPQQEEQARLLAEELARAPGRDLVVTFAMNFVEVASVKIESGDLEGAQLAIDAFDGILKELGPRLGDAEAALKSVLAQLQMAYAQRAGAVPPPRGSPPA